MMKLIVDGSVMGFYSEFSAAQKALNMARGKNMVVVSATGRILASRKGR